MRDDAHYFIVPRNIHRSTLETELFSVKCENTKYTMAINKRASVLSRLTVISIPKRDECSTFY